MFRRAWMGMVGCCVALLAVGFARAADITFQSALNADGIVCGMVSGTVRSTAADGRVSWTLENVHFAARTTPGARVDWPESNDSGSGIAAPGSGVTLKVFDLIIKQSSGVDVAYRFRLVADVVADDIQNISLSQAS